jgi:hypothetical protein
MSIEIKICIDGPEDEAADLKEDKMEKDAKAAALKKLLKGSKMSDESLSSFIELLTAEKED